jgi:hypothetical protein
MQIAEYIISAWREKENTCLFGEEKDLDPSVMEIHWSHFY